MHHTPEEQAEHRAMPKCDSVPIDGCIMREICKKYGFEYRQVGADELVMTVGTSARDGGEGMMTDLRPCPFCGYDMVGIHTSEYWSAQCYMPYAFVVCASCGAQGPIAQRNGGSDEQCKVEAMRKWERRTA